MLNFVRREDELHSRKDREELAEIGLETVMKMFFLHDFIHADLVRLNAAPPWRAGGISMPCSVVLCVAEQNWPL